MAIKISKEYQRILDKINLEMIVVAFPSLEGKSVVENNYLILSQEAANRLLKDPRFIDLTRYSSNSFNGGTGEIGSIMGLKVIVSDEINKIVIKDESFNPSRRR